MIIIKIIFLYFIEIAALRLDGHPFLCRITVLRNIDDAVVYKVQLKSNSCLFNY